jgi:hypothetical protein
MNEQDKEFAHKADFIIKKNNGDEWRWGHIDPELAEKLEKFAELIRADEREAIAKMFEDAPALVPFAQNDKGGCMMCGFTPKLAMEAIRARGNT